MSTTRRNFLITAAAATTVGLASPIAAGEQPHQFHEYLTNVGIDSRTAPRDLRPFFKDSNRSILHIEANGFSFSVDSRNRGGQTAEDVNGLIREGIIKHFGAQPVLANV